MKKSQTPYWWWFDRHHNTKRSPWLQSTLAELDQRTQTILKLVEEDADSFAQRAEMYYKKRPQLISMIEEFYRTHRSLIERYDQLKSDSATRHRLLLANLSSPFSFSTKTQPENKFANMELKYYADSETSFDIDLEAEDSAESEIDDPEQANEVLDDNDIKEGVLGMMDDVEARTLRKEIERLREENRIQKEQLKQKDEEKKEVIRQLSLAVNLLKDDNARLRKSAGSGIEFNKRNPFDLGRFKGTFLRKLFHESRTFQGTNAAT